MAEIIYFNCLKYSYKLIDKSCNCMIMVGSRKAVTARRKSLISSGVNPLRLAIIKTSQQQKNEYQKTGNTLVFMTLENWA
ncbi:MAG: hypothetical protein ACOY31_03470 [Bacillota bacterium]